MITYRYNLALNIDSSAAFDRRKPSRGFRRWKALPEIKDTVSSSSQKKKEDFSYSNISTSICF
jgi:hypothetical protein